MTTATAYIANIGEFQTYAEAHGTYPLKAALCNGYAYNAAHNNADDITGELSGGSYARVALTGVEWSVIGDEAAILANDPTFAAFTGTYDTLVVLADMGADSASPLIAHYALTGATSTAEPQTIDFPAGKVVTYQGIPEVLTVAGVSPDSNGDVPLASLAALLGGTGGSVAPIFVTAEPSATLDLEDHYDGGRPMIVTVAANSNGTRPEILWGDPATYAGQVVAIVPAANPGTTSYVYGASAGWHIGATPGVLGDLVEAITNAAGNDLNFTGGDSETFTLTVAGTGYDATLTADYTGDPVAAFTALISGWIADGAPVTAELNYLDPVGSRAIVSALVTTGTGSSQTIEVTDAGTGDRLELLGLTATDGLDDAHEGYNGTGRGTGELNGGYNYTHTWMDLQSNALKRLVVQAVDDGVRPQWARIDASVRSEDLPYTPGTSGDWAALAGFVPDNVAYALDLIAANAGGGGGGGGDITTDSAWAAKGDLIVATDNNAASVLTVGANDTILMAASGETTGTKWANASTVRTAIGVPQALNGNTGLWIGTAAEYAAIGTPSATVVYVVTP